MTVRKFSGQRLCDARTAANVSREWLALEIERTAQTVFVYESGRVLPPVNVLVRIVDTLGCTFDDLFVEVNA